MTHAKTTPERQKKIGVKLSLLLQRVLVYTVLGFLSGIIILIFYILIITATRQSSQISQGLSLIPGKFFMYNLRNLMDNTAVNALRAMRNSLFISLSSAVLTTYFSAMTAYGIHLYRFKGRKFLFAFILAVMMIPTQIAVAGLFSLIYQFHLTNRFFVLIIPSIAAPATFFFMKQYYDSILPYEVIESARIDGASEWRIFHQFGLPMVIPALAVQFIFGFVASYNNFFLPSLVLTDSTKKTIPVVLALLSGSAADTFDLGMVYMFIMFAIISILVFYIIVSQKIIKGVTLGSVKG